MREQLAANGLTPEQMAADTASGRDENHVIAESFGVERIAPVPGRCRAGAGPVPGRAPPVEAGELTLDDFAHHEVTGSVEACPAGHAPRHVTRDEATHTTVVEMPASRCASCPLLKLCPIRPTKDGRCELTFTDQARRLAARRVEEVTEVFRERYAARSGIESTNSGLKNRLSLGWLRVRGRGAVFRTLLLKVGGWNVPRAAASEKRRAMVQAQLVQLLGTGWAWPFGHPPSSPLRPKANSCAPRASQNPSASRPRAQKRFFNLHPSSPPDLCRTRHAWVFVAISGARQYSIGNSALIPQSASLKFRRESPFSQGIATVHVWLTVAVR